MKTGKEIWKYLEGLVENPLGAQVIHPQVSQPSELLSCPFCGSMGEIRDSEDILTKQYTFYIRCTNKDCYCKLGENYVYDSAEHLYNTFNEAKAAWNKRVVNEGSALTSVNSERG